MTSYDGHIIIKSIEKELFKNIFIIPNNSEKYSSFSLSKLLFLDSYQFLNSSLAQLTEYLRQSGEDQFVITKNIFSNYWQDYKDLILKKGIYPYDYMCSFEKFEETKLPPKELFYSKLQFENISDEDYNHALSFWDAFNCKNIGNYMDIYMLLDTCLLSDIFQNFRKLCLNYYELEPLQFYSTPGIVF